MDFTLQDLGMAYRKAKVDLYYSMIPRLEEIAAYEENLEENLERLATLLNGVDERWVHDSGFLGGWTYVPKSIDWASGDSGSEQMPSLNGFIESSPERKWKRMLAEIEQKPGGHARATFRLMALCSLDLHVLSTLWILRVGHKFDAALTESAFGSRLRRTGEGRELNELSLGTFKPYFWPFREWRDRGIQSMTEALKNGKKVVALTGDISSYYHRLDPGFLESSEFQEMAQVEFGDESEEKLNRLFVAALHAWAAQTPTGRGLPVGLPASAIVANAALIELDRFFERQVVPLYYGRYVDDIMLVMENGADFDSADAVWEWLFRRTALLAPAETTSDADVAFKPSYLAKSEVVFANKKNKIFLLEGATGATLVKSIERTIHDRASEWRALPDLPSSADDVATDLIATTQSDGENADNLRKADVLTMRRAAFAIKLRDFEAYERDLENDAWQELRHAFFDAVICHVLSLPNYFDLAQYVPRVVRLAVICQDFEHLRKILKAVATVQNCVVKDCKPAAADHKAGDALKIFRLWADYLDRSIGEAVVAAFPPLLSSLSKENWKANIVDQPRAISTLEAETAAKIMKRQRALFSRDLAHQPFRVAHLPDELASKRGVPKGHIVKKLVRSDSFVDHQVLAGVELLSSELQVKNRERLPVGFLFPTRPFSLHEALLAIGKPITPAVAHSLGEIMLALRGFSLNDQLPILERDEETCMEFLRIPLDGAAEVATGKRSVAIASWKTGMTSWTASVMQSAEPDVARYWRLNRLVNQVLQAAPIDYLVFPELAIPPRWFLRLAQKLHGRRISLISGVEYIHTASESKHVVRNQVWAALAHDGMDFPSMLIVRQDKQRPAPAEKVNLSLLRSLELVPQRSHDFPMVVQHGNFHFAMLICSELTNIDYRAALRGKVDALFVPEWNKDTNTFESLVESAALDLHAFIVQCNDRRYGDSRIRAPYKETWQRDVIRIKGGVKDYFVVGEVEYLKLREFQSWDQSPPQPFKPIPDGFELSEDRRELPNV